MPFNPPGPVGPMLPNWAQVIIDAHNQVADGAVSHAARMKSDRYFVWQEEDEDDLCADDAHDETAVTGYTDLFTKMEFDRWAREIGRAFDAAGIIWEKTGCTYEPDTGFFHHTWKWTVV